MEKTTWIDVFLSGCRKRGVEFDLEGVAVTTKTARTAKTVMVGTSSRDLKDEQRARRFAEPPKASKLPKLS